MAIKTKQWSAGGGSAPIEYDGQGDGDESNIDCETRTYAD